MTPLDHKKEIILQRELIFANTVGESLFEKPVISFWMIVIPLLFLYFIYRMQQYKSGRLKFDEEFMVTRRRAMDSALNGLTAGGVSNTEAALPDAGLPEALRPAYIAWLKILTGYYEDLLSADGDSFAALVRSAYGNKTNYLLVLNRLTSAEKTYHEALRPLLGETEATGGIISTMETRSQQLRREMAEEVFA
jgi:hypothetical protein